MRELRLFGKPYTGISPFSGGTAELQYLMRIFGKTIDTTPFTDPYLANTALAEVGALKVVELDGTWSADGTKINFTTQTTPVWGDDYVRDNVVRTRIRGLMGAGRVIIDDVTKQALFGVWNKTTLNSTGVQGFVNVSSVLRIRDNATSIITAIAVTNGDQIDWISIARATGSHLLVSINGGNWQLAWWFDTDATATLNAGFSNLDASGSLNLISSVVVPESAIPSPIASDDYSLIPTIVDSSVNALMGTPERVGLDGGNAHFHSPNSRIDLYSAAFEAFFDGELGTIVARAKTSSLDVWTNGVTKHICRFAAGPNDQILLQIPTPINRILGVYKAGGTQITITDTTNPPFAGIFTTGLTWDLAGDTVRFFTEGTQVSTDQSGLGTWSTTLDPDFVHIGSATDIDTNNMNGSIYDFIVANSEISIANMASLDTKLLAETLTAADLDDYFTAGNWLWYKLDEQYSTDGLGDLEASGYGANLLRNGRTFSSEGNKRYNGAVGGADLITNGDFAAWTGDDPDDFTVTDDATDTITRDRANDVVVFTEGLSTGTTPQIAQFPLTIGEFYKHEIIIDSNTTNLILRNAGTALAVYTTSGTKIVTHRATSLGINLLASSVIGSANVSNWQSVLLPIADLLDLTNTNQAEHYIAINATIIDDTQGGVGVAWDSAKQAGIAIYYDRAMGDKVIAAKFVAGVFDSEIINVAKTYSAAATLRVSFSDIDADGTYDLTVWYNDEFVASVPVSDVAIVGNTYAGLFGFPEEGFAEKEVVMLANEGNKYVPYFVGAFPTGFGFSSGFSNGFK